MSNPALRTPARAARRSTRVSGEPDCSPHLFDILAIYALYQNVRQP